MGENGNSDGMVSLVGSGEDVTPLLISFMAGLEILKIVNKMGNYFGSS